MSEKYEAHFHGTTQGMVIGDNNTVTIFLSNGEKVAVPFLAPPRPRQSIVGRDILTSDIKELLLNDNCPTIITLNGLPGVGKTALALTIAYNPEILARFSDGILWASLGQNANLMLVLGAWCKALCFTPQEIASLGTVEGRVLAIHNAVGMKHMLLIIDDVWSAEDALTFNVGGPNCARIMTTRLPELAAQITPHGRIQVSELTEENSLLLLSLLAPEAIASDLENARTLVKAVGGLPLAIQLMGNYLRMQSTGGQRRIEAAINKLQNAEERLNLTEPLGPLEIHPSLRRSNISLNTIIQISVHGLSDFQRKAFYSLGVFPCKPMTFSEKAASIVSGAPVDVLDILAETGLVEVNQQSRYTLHQAISEYCQLHIEDNGSYQKMIEHYLGYLHKHTEDFDLLDQESHNILAAIDKAYELGFYPAAIQGTLDLHEYLEVRGLHLTAIAFFERARDVARLTKDYNGLTNVLFYLGHMKEKRGELDVAEAYLNEAHNIAREQGDKNNICKILRILGWVAGGRGNYEKAILFFQEGLDLCRSINYKNIEGGFLHGLGWAASKNAAYDLAEKYLLDGLEIERQNGSRESIGMSLNDIGAVLTIKRDFEKAETYLFEGLKLARDLGYQEHIIQQLSALGDLEIRRCQYVQAETYLNEALNICDKTEISRLTNNLMSMCGKTAIGSGNYVLAETYLNEGIQLAQSAGRQEFEMILLALMGDLCIKTGRKNLAYEYAQRGLMLAESVNHPENHIELLLLSAHLHIDNLEFDSAQDDLTRADKMAALIRRLDLVSRVRRFESKIANAKGRLDIVEKLCQESLLLAEQTRAIEEQILAFEQLAQHGLATSQLEQSGKWAKRGLLQAENYGLLENIANLQFILAKVANEKKQNQQAVKLGIQSQKLYEHLGHASAIIVSNWLNNMRDNKKV